MGHLSGFYKHVIPTGLALNSPALKGLGLRMNQVPFRAGVAGDFRG